MKKTGLRAATVLLLPAFTILLTTSLLRVPVFFEQYRQILELDFSAEVRTALVYWGLTLIAAILILGFSLGYVPAKIDQEKEKAVDKLQKEKDVLKERLKPKLKIEYVEGQSPYFQTTLIEFEDHIERETLFRIAVVNVSEGNTVDAISAVLRSAEPEPLQYLKDTELHIRHDVVRQLNPKGRLFVDVIAVRETWMTGGVGEPRYAFFFFDEAKIRKEIPIQDYELIVAASGRDTVAKPKTFVFSIDDELNYRFVAKRRRRRKKA